MDSIEIPVPAAELCDKISILRIKAERIPPGEKLDNVKRELGALLNVREDIPESKTLSKNEALLKHTNELLWVIEDAIRTCEVHNDFGEFFILLARMVYLTNDERSRIKKRINTLLGSKLVEEKHFSSKMI